MKVVFNLIAPLAQLETKKGKRYTAIEISRISDVNRQTIRNFMTEPPDQINTSTLGKLLQFFADEGMPIQIGDLFTVSTTTESE